MSGYRRLALALIAVAVIASSLTAFAESYRALVIWAEGHGLHGVWAALFPAQIDTFVLVGELALFVALADRWAVRSRLLAWAVTVGGLAASVAGNVGHIAGTDLASRVTAAVPPLAAAAALTVGLGVLKRVVARPETPLASGVIGSPASDSIAALNGHAHEAAELFAAELAEHKVPSVRAIRREMHLGQPRAQEVHSYLTALARTP